MPVAPAVAPRPAASHNLILAGGRRWRGIIDAVGDQATLRVFSFRPDGSGSAFDEAVRSTIVPHLLGVSGLRDVFIGRRADDDAERVIASVWETPEAMATMGDEPTLIARHLAQVVPEIDDPRLDIGSLEIAVRRERPEAPRILRLFRGVAETGRLEAYIERAHEGTLEEAASNPGLVALYLGTTGPTTFVTVSAWASWDAIEDATGGNVNQPTVTRHSALLSAIDVVHFEIVPNAGRPSACLDALTVG
jgi:heme-degrading monooxygenase HmoA